MLASNGRKGNYSLVSQKVVGFYFFLLISNWGSMCLAKYVKFEQRFSRVILLKGWERKMEQFLELKNITHNFRREQGRRY